MSRIPVTLTIYRPSGAVVVFVHALSRCNLTRNRAIKIHKVWIRDAVALCAPKFAVVKQISNQRRTHTTACGTILVHIVWRRLTLSLPSPHVALLVQIRTRVVAHGARMWTQAFHNIIRIAKAVSAPTGARNILIVAESHGVRTRGEKSKDEEKATTKTISSNDHG